MTFKKVIMFILLGVSMVSYVVKRGNREIQLTNDTIESMSNKNMVVYKTSDSIIFDTLKDRITSSAALNIDTMHMAHYSYIHTSHSSHLSHYDYWSHWSSY